VSIPITVIAGYLGAGKTTLINRVLQQQSDITGLAILVNDFGDINIDAALLSQENIGQRVVGLSNGCVCCSLQDDFASSLETLKQLQIQHILFEASGIARPAKLRAQCHYPGFHANRVLVVVDGQQYTKQTTDKYIGALVLQQVQEADALVISKFPAKALVERLAKAKPILEQNDDFISELLMTHNLTTASQSGGSELPTPFVSITLSQRYPQSLKAMKLQLEALPAWVTRVKGFARSTEGRVLIQRVGQVVNIEPTQASGLNQLVLISAQPDKQQQLHDHTRHWSAWRS